MVKLSAEETLAFDFRSRVSFAFHQNIQRCFVVFSTYSEQQEISQTVELEQSRQHRVILRELIAELDAVAAYFGENFEDAVLGNLVVNDELDYLAKLNEELTIALRNWHLMESITFSSPRMLSVHFAGWLQNVCPIALPLSFNEAKVERRQEFWSQLNALTMRGQLLQARNLLCKHSEIAAILSTEAGSLAERAVTSALGGITRAHCEDLLNLFDSHPFASLVRDMSLPQSYSPDSSFVAYEEKFKRIEALSPQQLSRELLLFAENVQAVRQSRTPLLLRNPSLDHLLRILQGESSVLVHEAQGHWAVLSLAKLLYCYAPGISRHNLSDILHSSAGSVSLNELGADQLLLQLAKDALAGKVLSVLTVLHRVHSQLLRDNSEHRAGTQEASAALLQALCHLALLLQDSQLHPELSAALPTSDDHLSLTQELCLQTAQLLNALETHPKMTVFYLRQLPDQLAGSYLDTLLTRRRYCTDALARNTSQMLSILGRSMAASELLAVHAADSARALYVSFHCTAVTPSTLLPDYHNHTTNSSNHHHHHLKFAQHTASERFAGRYKLHRQSAACSLPRSVSFAAAAADGKGQSARRGLGRLGALLAESRRWSRLRHLLQTCLADLATAFVHGSSPLLQVLMASASLSASSSSETPDMSSDTPVPQLLLPAVCNSAEDLLYHLHSHRQQSQLRPRHTQDRGTFDEKELDLWTLVMLLDRAEDLVDATARHLVATSSSDSRPNLPQHYNHYHLESEDSANGDFQAACVAMVSLQHYAVILRHLLSAPPLSNANIGNIGSSSSSSSSSNSIPSTTEAAVYANTESLRTAAETAAELAWLLRPAALSQAVDDLPSAATIIRSGVSAHCVELACVLHSCVATLELTQSRDTAFLRFIEKQQQQQVPSAGSLPVSRHWCGGVLTLTQTQRLCHLAHHFVNQYSRRCDGVVCKVRKEVKEEEDDDEVRAVWLRLRNVAEGCFVSASHADALAQLLLRRSAIGSSLHTIMSTAEEGGSSDPTMLDARDSQFPHHLHHLHHLHHHHRPRPTGQQPPQPQEQQNDSSSGNDNSSSNNSSNNILAKFAAYKKLRLPSASASIPAATVTPSKDLPPMPQPLHHPDTRVLTLLSTTMDTD